MLSHPDWPHARPTAAVWNAKSLMQIQMTNIRANISRTAQTYLGVHIRPVHIHLPAMADEQLSHTALMLSSNTPCVEG